MIEEMDEEDEKHRSAAALALGGVAAGSVQKFFPALLDYVQQTTSPVKRSLVLHSIKEVLFVDSFLRTGHYI